MPTTSLIPLGELKCLWMDAGVVDYKLCDLQYRCEQCPFDAFIRQQLGRASPEETFASADEPYRIEHVSLPGIFNQVLSALLAPLYNPLLLPELRYTQNHVWLRNEKEHTFVCGIDHIVLHLLGPVRGVAYPNALTKTRHHAPCAWIVFELGTLAFKAPFAGIVVAVNDSLKRWPNLVNTSPYSEGWILRLQAEGDRNETANLLTPEQASHTYHQQADEFAAACRQVMRRKFPAVGATLHDGGRVIESIEGMLGPAAYFDAVVRMLRLS